MGFSRFFEVEDEVRRFFINRVSKADWYNAMVEMEKEKNFNTLRTLFDPEEYFRTWEYVYAEKNSWISPLFFGDMHPTPNEYGSDPSVVFIGKNLVRSLCQEMKKHSSSEFRQDFIYKLRFMNDYDPKYALLFYNDMRDFICEASNHYKAMIILWGN